MAAQVQHGAGGGGADAAGGAEATGVLAAVLAGGDQTADALAQSIFAEFGEDITLGELITRIGEWQKARIWRRAEAEVQRLKGVAEGHLREAQLGHRVV
eukprot:CAMPEP_0179299650 /NCGR_PEP_ID=MMETSP0797-20121207/46626_1 /TAXON_ID=47934 /ORGANISM="Dinophysis acuminata, Strain DAEP01" /LENGTH=98 /DNA_ID=CAMNT_0021009091 /DNA_START=56 /DNA_END=352 /DNA_ORIENTATION=-